MSDLELIDLVQGELFNWQLPEIEAGLYPLEQVIFEPSESLLDSISFDEGSLTLEFNGEVSSEGGLHKIDIWLVNSRGDKVHYQQNVLLSVKENEIDEQVDEDGDKIEANTDS